MIKSNPCYIDYFSADFIRVYDGQNFKEDFTDSFLNNEEGIEEQGQYFFNMRKAWNVILKQLKAPLYDYDNDDGYDDEANSYVFDKMYLCAGRKANGYQKNACCHVMFGIDRLTDHGFKFLIQSNFFDKTTYTKSKDPSNAYSEVYSYVNMYPYQEELSPENLKKIIKTRHGEYRKAILASKNPLKIIEAIGKFIFKLEHEHVFKNGNARTNCMIILNYLLFEIGFPPCILDDPLSLSLCGPKEIVHLIIKGMENGLKVLEKIKIEQLKFKQTTTIEAKKKPQASCCHIY